MFLSPKPPPHDLSSVPSSSFSLNTLEEVSSTDLALGVKGGGLMTRVELRGQAGLGGQVEGGRRRGGGRAPWLQTKWVSGCQDPNGEKAPPLYPPYSSSALGWAQTKNLPHDLPKARPFTSRAGAEDEAMRSFHISLTANPGQPAPTIRTVNTMGKI